MLDFELVSAKVVSLGSMTFFRAPTSIGSPKAVPHGSERLKGLVVFRAPVVSIGFVFKELTSERVRRKKTHPTCAMAFCQIDISCLVSGLKGDFSHSFTGETCELHTAIHLER